ncbi:MAG TPA: hypothetical protein VLL31_06490, partial [Sulfurovum sp.]|nr:hypothetical protein [Sulfurovum sp.]
MEFEQAVEYFSILGGMGKNIELDYFDDVLSMVRSNFVHNFTKFQNLVSPSYLLENPYRDILIAVARGDGKLYSVLRKAKLSETLGEKIVEELVELNVLKVETSRESPL